MPTTLDLSRPQLNELDTVDFLIRTFREKGDSAYLGEAVSQLEHALQAAWLAEQEGASPALVTAALLHDVGHLLHDLPDNCARRGVDDRHENLGARWLRRHFTPEVVEPIRLHVASKRCLCGAEPEYLAGLSPASRLSLRLQGGPMTEWEQLQFRCHPYSTAALRVRRWDDLAKVSGLETPDLEFFRSHLLEAARRAVPAVLAHA